MIPNSAGFWTFEDSHGRTEEIEVHEFNDKLYVYMDYLLHDAFDPYIRVEEYCNEEENWVKNLK